MASNGIVDDLQTLRGHAAHDSALGAEVSREDALRLKDLEEQNDILAEKAASASQRFADYENEIRVLQAKLRQQERRGLATPTGPSPITAQSPHSDASPPPPPEKDRAPISRFGSFISRKPILSPGLAGVSSPSPREQELQAALAKEQSARLAAENKAQEVNMEIEELSATLFQQANEMVATERKENAALKQTIQLLEHNRSKSDEAIKMENAALKERMRMLEKKSGSVDDSMRIENQKLKQKILVMEQREDERKRRLDRLEAAQKRIDRVRAMLIPP